MAHHIGQMLQLVAGDRLELDRHAQLVQLFREVQRIGVLAVRREHLRPNRDNLRVHRSPGFTKESTNYDRSVRPAAILQYPAPYDKSRCSWPAEPRPQAQN